MHVVKEHFRVRGNAEIKTFPNDRGMLWLDDNNAKMRMIDTGSIVESGVQMPFAPWRIEFT